MFHFYVSKNAKLMEKKFAVFATNFVKKLPNQRNDLFSHEKKSFTGKKSNIQFFLALFKTALNLLSIKGFFWMPFLKLSMFLKGKNYPKTIQRQKNIRKKG